MEDLSANPNTVVSERLTRAMVFSPLGAITAGLGMIISLVASAHARRGINIVSQATALRLLVIR